MKPKWAKQEVYSYFDAFLKKSIKVTIHFLFCPFWFHLYFFLFFIGSVVLPLAITPYRRNTNIAIAYLQIIHAVFYIEKYCIALIFRHLKVCFSCLRRLLSFKPDKKASQQSARCIFALKIDTDWYVKITLKWHINSPKNPNDTRQRPACNSAIHQ